MEKTKTKQGLGLLLWDSGLGVPDAHAGLALRCLEHPIFVRREIVTSFQASKRGASRERVLEKQGVQCPQILARVCHACTTHAYVPRGSELSLSLWEC